MRDLNKIFVDVTYGRGSVLLWRKWTILGENVPDKPITPMNCELDWPMQ